MSNITATIKDWNIHLNYYGLYIIGEIHGDTKGRWPDGKRFYTSQMTGYEASRDGIVMMTLNSVYWLAYEDSNHDSSAVCLFEEALEKARILV